MSVGVPKARVSSLVIRGLAVRLFITASPSDLDIPLIMLLSLYG